MDRSTPVGIPLTDQSASAIAPLGPGNSSEATRSRCAAPRPLTRTRARRERSRPAPPPTNPCHRPDTVTISRSAPGQRPTGNNTAPRCRARAASRCRSPGRNRSTPATATRSSPSNNAAVTATRSGPGRGTNATRCSAKPASAAATRPTSGSPTSAHQAPSADASDNSASSNAVDERTETVLPRRRPCPGSTDRSGVATGNTNSSSTGADIVGADSACRPPHVLVALPSKLLASCNRAARTSAAGATPTAPHPRSFTST